MKIIFEQTEFNSYEKERVAEMFPYYRKSKNDPNDCFEILIDDFPTFLKDDINIWYDVFYDRDGNLAKNAVLISGKIPEENEGLYLVECERIERYEGEIIQRVWIAFQG